MDEVGEAELMKAARAGVVIGSARGPKRAIQAALVRKCCYELADRVDPRGLRLSKTVVVGGLDLAGLRVPFPLHFDGCEFEFAPVFEGAEFPGLSLTGCEKLPGLLGNGLRLQRDLDLSRSRVAGAHWTSASILNQAAIWLCEAVIGGQLLCSGTQVDGLGGRSIKADRVQVGGAVRFFQRFRSAGGVRMVGARIGGAVDLTGARIESATGPAVDLEAATIGGSIFLVADPSGQRPVVNGRLELSSAQIGGRLAIRDATIRAHSDEPQAHIYSRPTAPNTAISADRVSVGAAVTLAGDTEVIGRIDMSMGDLTTLFVDAGCVLRAPGATALDLVNTEFRSMFRVDADAVIEGSVRLAGAIIHGTLALHGQLSRPEHQTLIGASGVKVDGDVYLNDLRTDGGTVTFRGATLGSFSADRARLRNPPGYSLRLSQAQVRGSVRLIDGFSSVGLVALNRTEIGARLMFTGGSFDCPGPGPGNENGHAIEVISATVRGGLDLGWRAVSPSVDFTNAVTTFLADDPAMWPQGYIISGLSYDRFEHPQGAPTRPIWDQVARCDWLARQTDFDPGAYEQAAKVFRQHGHAREAEQILIAQRRQARHLRRHNATLLQRVADAMYAIIGYGYRPSRVLWLIAVLLVLVTATLESPASQSALRATSSNGTVYTTTGPLPAAGHALIAAGSADHSSHADSCGSGAVRCFGPALYAIDTVVPLVSLDQRSTWYPDPHVADGELLTWWLNIATLLGWILSSIFALSLARLSRSQL